MGLVGMTQARILSCRFGNGARSHLTEPREMRVKREREAGGDAGDGALRDRSSDDGFFEVLLGFGM